VWCDSNFTYKLADGPDQTNLNFNEQWTHLNVAGIRPDYIGFMSGRTINISTTGGYTFTLGADDGARLWVDGNIILDLWSVNQCTTQHVVTNLTAGDHQLRLDYYEGYGVAWITFNIAPTPT
jgi:hypothetical protein